MVIRTYPIRVAGNSGPMPEEIEWIDLAKEINWKLKKLHQDSLVNPVAINAFIDTQTQIARKMNLPLKPLPYYTSEERKQYSTQLVNLHKEVLKELHEDIVLELRKLFEITTVTKKLRRISELDFETLKYAVQLNRPAYLVLNFLNYKFPSLYFLNPKHSWKLSPEIQLIESYLTKIEKTIGVKIKFVNFNPWNIQPR
jgi:hypothetical protein